MFAVLTQSGLASAGDVGKGRAAFVKCHFCHQVGEKAKNAVGPTLNGVVGRLAASVAGFDYSQAMRGSGKVWNEEELRLYIGRPASAVPGTKMTFAGIADPEGIDDIIAYLKQFRADGTPAP